jgi:hypothetical protein
MTMAEMATSLFISSLHTIFSLDTVKALPNSIFSFSIYATRYLDGLSLGVNLINKIN